MKMTVKYFKLLAYPRVFAHKQVGYIRRCIHALVKAGVLLFITVLAICSGVAHADTYWAYRGKINYSFTSPYKIAVDQNSNVYVLDDNGYKVTKFNSAGNLVCSVGSQGTGNSQFAQPPTAITVDSTGQYFYVVEGNSVHRVQKFAASNCAYVLQWGSFDSNPTDGHFSFPEAIATDSSGNVYVADTPQLLQVNRVQEFSSAGTFLSKWTPTARIHSLTYANGALYATQPSGMDSWANIVKYSLSGVVQSQVGTGGLGTGQIYDGEQLAVNSSNIFEADGWGRRFQVFDLSGGYVTGVGKNTNPGTGLGEFSDATGIGVDGNQNVYIADHGSTYVQKFSTTAYQTPIKIDETLSGTISDPSMASDNNGILNVTYSGGGDLKYAKWNGASWSLSTIEAGIIPYTPAIAVDAQGNPHVVYSKIRGSYGTKYAKWNGVAWSTYTIANVAVTGYPPSSAIAVDGAGNPHITYWDGVGTINYSRYDGAAWSTYTVTASNGGLAQIALSSKGEPYVAYWDSSTKEVKLATWTGTGFNSTVVASMLGGRFGFTLDGDNHPQVVYTENDINPTNLRYTKWNGALWSSPEIVVPGMATVKSFQLDGNGVPHVFYSNLGTGLIHAYKSGASWVSEIIDATTYAGKNGASNVFDSSGRQQIVYVYQGPGDSYDNARLLFSQWTGSGYPQAMGGNSRGKLQMPTSFQGSRSGTNINWTWGDNSSNETGFRLYGSTNSSGPFSLIADTNLLTPGSVSFNETSLATGATYYRYVSAVNSGGSVTSWFAGVYVPNPVPTVTSIVPNSGMNTAGVNVTNLAGTNFISAPTVKLAKTGQSDIAATNVVFINATQLTCTLPITGVTAGQWNVVVTNPDTQSASLTNGFTVTGTPTTPLNPAFTARTTTSLTASWATVPSANYVAVLASDSGYSIIVSSVTQSGTTKAYNGLSASIAYYFEVKLSTETDAAFAVNQISTTTIISNVGDIVSGPQQKSFKTTLGDNLFNPRTGGTSKVKFNVPTAGRVSLKIYDLSGRLIRTLYEGDATAGDVQKDWDGKDDSGRYVIPSVYFLHYVYPGGKEVRNIGVKK